MNIGMFFVLGIVLLVSIWLALMAHPAAWALVAIVLIGMIAYTVTKLAKGEGPR